jgi:hypothetical protein
MNDQIDAEPLQQQKQDEIKIPANEKKNITHVESSYKGRSYKGEVFYFNLMLNSLQFDLQSLPPCRLQLAAYL